MTDNEVALSVDVEDWYHVPAVTGSSFAKYDSVDHFFRSWEGRYDYLTKPTYRTLELLDAHDVTATFFIVADVVDRYPGLVEEIATRGHEIGCHGLHHECAIDADTKQPRFSRPAYRDRLLEAKRVLEDATGQSVTGFRAPGGYVAGWMLDVLEEVGFTYDSSVSKNSLYNKTDSELRGVGTTPYVPQTTSLEPHGERTFVELPWPYLETRVAKIPVGGGPMLRFLPRPLLSYGLSQALKRGDTSFYFHPIDLARESFPAVGNAKKRPFYWTNKGRGAESKLDSLLSDIGSNSICTCEDAARKIHQRHVHAR